MRCLKDANTFGDAHETLFISLSFQFLRSPDMDVDQEATFVACAVENVLKCARDQSGEPKTLQRIPALAVCGRASSLNVVFAIFG
jgi:hypothetical protein